jgi:hypothetical protein
MGKNAEQGANGIERQARARLAVLRQELGAGQRQLSVLDERRAHLADTMLRITGAIQVLEELLGESGGGHGAARHSAGEGATDGAASSASQVERPDAAAPQAREDRGS